MLMAGSAGTPQLEYQQQQHKVEGNTNNPQELTTTGTGTAADGPDADDAISISFNATRGGTLGSDLRE